MLLENTEIKGADVNKSPLETGSAIEQGPNFVEGQSNPESIQPAEVTSPQEQISEDLKLDDARDAVKPNEDVKVQETSSESLEKSKDPGQVVLESLINHPGDLKTHPGEASNLLESAQDMASEAQNPQ